MGLPQILILFKLIILSVLSHCESAGFDIPSLAAASVLLRVNLGTLDIRSHRTKSQSFLQNDPVISPMSTSPSFGLKRHGMLIAPPPNEAFHPSPTKAPVQHNAMRKSIAPSTSSFKHPEKNSEHGSAFSLSWSFYMHHHAKNKIVNLAPRPSSPAYGHQGVGPSISPLHSRFPSTRRWSSPAHAPSPTTISSQSKMPIPPPTVSPLSSSFNEKATPPHSPLLALPPPPPNEECTSVTCKEPLTYTAPGSPCGCVWPIEVRLQLSVALYTFFPLVSELAKEIAASVSLNRCQVRIMGANTASQQLEKTVVLINMVPSRENFDESTAFLIYKKFWHKQVFIKTALFGAYEVIQVRYPGYASTFKFLGCLLKTKEKN